ncbi:Hypothetical predicted protein [Lecanosticta acicola]|uniref:Thioesterase-like superfamily-domain-containing protein n=1 Tax=Lecanosticta acicola TaxID=111012 RepID=A0AAI8YYL0_9PEZI|nr:Hypothetical predicted protein [Lecanosticta acicola]
MAQAQRYDFEDQFRLTPLKDNPDVFTNTYPLWSWPNLTRVAGSITLVQAARAGYCTVPDDYAMHGLQAHFLKPGLLETPMQYEVERIMTSQKFACRTVRVRQEGVIRAYLVLNFQNKAIDEKRPAPFDYMPSVDKETLRDVAKPIDPRLEDFNHSSSAAGPRMPPDWPSAPRGAQYPAIRTQRLSVSDEAEISERIYRCKLGIASPLSGPMAQILAIVFLSDLYTGDGPLTIQHFDFGAFSIGDLTKTPTKPCTTQWATLNHSLHFRKLDGWDACEDVLFEVKLRWAKGRRAVTQLTIRDKKGEVIATAEQEASLPSRRPNDATVLTSFAGLLCLHAGR